MPHACPLGLMPCERCLQFGRSGRRQAKLPMPGADAIDSSAAGAAPCRFYWPANGGSPCWRTHTAQSAQRGTRAAAWQLPGMPGAADRLNQKRFRRALWP
jgi:hypothetical protein